MTHYLHLNDRPFELIKSGKKTVEMRLLDEKRKTYKVGDTLSTAITKICNLKLKLWHCTNSKISTNFISILIKLNWVICQTSKPTLPIWKAFIH